jgi:hypothetical protein
MGAAPYLGRFGGARHGGQRATACPYLYPSTIRGRCRLLNFSTQRHARLDLRESGDVPGDLMGTKAGPEPTSWARRPDQSRPHLRPLARLSRSGHARMIAHTSIENSFALEGN